VHRLHFSPKTIPPVLLILAILAYGLLIPWLGFYWDDWPFAWIAHFLGPGEFIPAFKPFRPFLGPIFLATTSLLGQIPLVWQLFGLLIRCLSALAAWWSLDKIWPEHRSQTLAVSLLFLVFPGYSQQWVAFTHVNQELIPLVFYLYSFGLTACALRAGQRRLAPTLSALLLLIVGLFPTEYFIGLEPLRFLFIGTILAESLSGFWQRLRSALKQWAPYALVWIADLLWLRFYYSSGEYASYDVTGLQLLRTPSWEMIVSLLRNLGEAIYKVGFYVWVQVLGLMGKAPTAPTTLVGLGLIIATYIWIAFYLTRLDFPPAKGKPVAWGQQALLIGLIGILLGRLPSWAAGLPLTLQSSYDRFTLSMMLGASLFIAGLVDLLLRRNRAKLYAISLLVALGIGQQFWNANLFRRDWAGQQELYWQFAWRIPALKPGTLLLTQQMPLDYETDLSMTAPLNWIYAPDFEPPNLPYALLYTEKRLGGPTLPALEPGVPVTVQYRTVTFHGSTSQALVIYAPSSGCLRVLDPVYANAETYEKESAYLTKAIPLSDPSNILTNASPPNLPAWLFGSEPEHTWCYYYEKAELSRQEGDWGQVVRLWEQAVGQGYSPTDPLEWLPFIEADAYTGDLKSAEQLSRQSLQAEPKLRKGLCSLWRRVASDAAGQPDLPLLADKLLTDFECPR
jgi:hypothetical protein